MRFENSFTVEAPIDRVWRYLLDVEAVAPCVPGAQLTEIVSDSEFKGTVKVKLGAVQMHYKGTLTLTEVDQGSHRVILKATGNETRGTGGASGTVTSTLTEDEPNHTTVLMVSELAVTGRVAQFGRNIMQDVANRLIREFAACLAANLTDAELSSGPAAEAAHPDAVPADAPIRSAETRKNGHASPRQVDPDNVATASDLSGPAKTPTLVDASESGGSVCQGGQTLRDPARSAVTPAIGAGSYGTSELKILPLLVDITRSRLAGGLRSLARLIDPEQ